MAPVAAGDDGLADAGTARVKEFGSVARALQDLRVVSDYCSEPLRDVVENIDTGGERMPSRLRAMPSATKRSGLRCLASSRSTSLGNLVSGTAQPLNPFGMPAAWHPAMCSERYRAIMPERSMVEALDFGERLRCHVVVRRWQQQIVAGDVGIGRTLNCFTVPCQISEAPETESCDRSLRGQRHPDLGNACPGCRIEPLVVPLEAWRFGMLPIRLRQPIGKNRAPGLVDR